MCLCVCGWVLYYFNSIASGCNSGGGNYCDASLNIYNTPSLQLHYVLDDDDDDKVFNVAVNQLLLRFIHWSLKMSSK